MSRAESIWPFIRPSISFLRKNTWRALSLLSLDKTQSGRKIARGNGLTLVKECRGQLV